MHKWTDDAKQELENYLQEVAALASQRGDDSSEIVEGLRDHVMHEAETNAEPFITAERVRLILSQLGTPEEVVGIEHDALGDSTSVDNETNASPDPTSVAEVVSGTKDSSVNESCYQEGAVRRGFSTTFQWFTVIVAFAAIFIGLGIRNDPNDLFFTQFGYGLMPSMLHFWALLVVPVAIIYNWCLFRACCKEKVCFQGRCVSFSLAWRNCIRIGLMLGSYVLVVSIFYMVLLLPFAIAGVILAIFLIGLLPLSPFFTFAVGILQLRQIGGWAKIAKISGLWILVGVLIALGFHGGWLVYHKMCSNAIQLAFSSDADDRREGIQTIKTLGAEGKILQGCYGSFPKPYLLVGEFLENDNSFHRDEFRKLYYRMTGVDYRSACPDLAGKVTREWTHDWMLEEEIGGDVVGIRVPDLSLNASMIDAVVAGDPDAKNAGPCVAYVEWVLEFRNLSSSQREARCQIQMPPGSVGSRLTLWIEDVEQEAAFGKRGTVKKAYKDVAVRQRRDPALLSTDGPDRLLLQCFPVQPHSKMKVKVGMSIPLMLRDREAVLRLPYLADRNFSIRTGMTHKIWVESVAPMRSSALEVEPPEESRYVVRGELTEADLMDGGKATIQLDSPVAMKTLYTAELHERAGTDFLVKNEPFEAEKGKSVRTVAIVVDASRVCKKVREFDWVSFFKSAPKGIDFSIFVGHKSKQNLSAEQASTTIREFLDKTSFDEADEQTQNLEAAWDLCAKTKHGLVLWIHGPMPVELSSYEGLLQRMTRRPGRLEGNNPRIASLPVVAGPNLIEQKLDSVAGMFRVPVLHSVDWTLCDIARNLNRPGLASSRLEFDFYDGPLTQDEILDRKSSETVVAKSSDQIVRIALGQKVDAEARGKLKGPKREKLAGEASRLRLITPLTGAVVLERKEQYAKHGLDPTINPEATADIPEPETWVLLIAIFIAFIFMVWRQKRRGTLRHGSFH